VPGRVFFDFLQVAEKNVRGSAICPGFFPAEQNRRLLDQQRIDYGKHPTENATPTDGGIGWGGRCLQRVG